MVKNSIKILIFMLIATVSYAYSAERPALERPDYEQEWGKRDSLRKVKREYRAQDKLTKKVTFETFEQNYAKAMRFYQKQHINLA